MNGRVFYNGIEYCAPSLEVEPTINNCGDGLSAQNSRDIKLYIFLEHFSSEFVIDFSAVCVALQCSAYS